MLAPINIFLPSLALGLSNEDFARWAACAWQAGLIDAFLLQPALAVLELNLSRPLPFSQH